MRDETKKAKISVNEVDEGKSQKVVRKKRRRTGGPGTLRRSAS